MRPHPLYQRVVIVDPEMIKWQIEQSTQLFFFMLSFSVLFEEYQQKQKQNEKKQNHKRQKCHQKITMHLLCINQLLAVERVMQFNDIAVDLVIIKVSHLWLLFLSIYFIVITKKAYN